MKYLGVSSAATALLVQAADRDDNPGINTPGVDMGSGDTEY